jgi:hypothetical protein
MHNRETAYNHFSRTISLSHDGITKVSFFSPLGEWNGQHGMVLYPFALNNLAARTHDGYLTAAREAQRRSNGGKDVSVGGIKGFSTLFQVKKWLIFFLVSLVSEKD